MTASRIPDRGIFPLLKIEAKITIHRFYVKKMAEHFNKRHKVDIKSIHGQLKKHEDDLLTALGQVDKFSLCFLRVLGCNGSLSRSFPDVWCETERISPSDFGALFKDCFDTNLLKQFIENGHLTNLNEDNKSLSLLALQKLSYFIDNLKCIFLL